MRVKTILRHIAVIMLALILSAPVSVAMAASPPTLQATANSGGNYVHLNWSEVGDKSQPWNYQIEQIKAGSSTPQTIPAKSTVKVLNVYPPMGWGFDTTSISFKTWQGVNYTLPTSASLKMWMEMPNPDNAKGYGKGLISVDTVSIADFNANPNTYLKNTNGSWKYDVVYFGSADGYGSDTNSVDLTTSSESIVSSFLKSGRGVLLGHDTATRVFDHPNFSDLATHYGNMRIDIPTPTSRMPRFGDTHVTIVRKGLLTNYPWLVGNVGTVLAIPLSHTYGQFVLGDIWMKFKTNIWEPSPELTTYQGLSGSNSVYLSTWNNMAMIQTGHSGGKATPDEQKVLANTLFYLSQLTQATSWDDHSGQDLAAPNAPTVSGVTPGSNSVSLNVGGSTDSGSLYTYDVVATGQNDGTKLKSNSVTTTVTSGLKGYAVSVDQNASGTPSASDIKSGSGGSVTVPVPNGNYYVHTAAFDNENNESPVVTRLVDRTNPVLSVSGNPSATVHSSVTLQAAASDSETCASGIKRVQTPDGAWHAGANASYTAVSNGSYTFKAQDNQGNVTTQTINVTHIGDKLWVSNPPTVSTSASTRDGSGPLLFSGPKFSIEDNRGTKSGWQVMAQATPLTDGRHALPEGSLLIKAPAISGPTAGPKAPFSGYQAIDRSNSVTIVSAAKGYGDGRYTIDSSASDGLKALVPARAYTGTYRSTVTTSLVEAP